MVFAYFSFGDMQHTPFASRCLDFWHSIAPVMLESVLMLFRLCDPF